VTRNTYSNNCNSRLFLSRLAGAVLGELGQVVGHRGVNVVVHRRLDVLHSYTDALDLVPTFGYVYLHHHHHRRRRHQLFVKEKIVRQTQLTSKL